MSDERKATMLEFGDGFVDHSVQVQLPVDLAALMDSPSLRAHFYRHDPEPLIRKAIAVVREFDGEYLLDLQERRASGEATFDRMMRFIEAKKNAEEFSEDWYLLKIYSLHADLEQTLPIIDRNPRDALGIAMELGAVCREFELSQANKVDTTTFRTRQRRFRDDPNNVRAAHNAESKADADEWKAQAREIAAGTKRTGAALHQFVQRELNERYGVERKVRTIRRALSKHSS